VKSSNTIVVPGEKSKTYLHKLGVDSRRIFTIGNPIDNQSFQKRFQRDYNSGKEVVRGKLRITDDPVFLFVGRLVDVKGLNDLLDAYILVKKKYPKAGLLIVGDGYLKESLQQYCEKLQIDGVRFEGYIQQESIGLYYLAADVFVFPSHYETWGLVINEAMIYGLPVVTTTRVGAAGEIAINHQTGAIVPPHNPEKLAQALIKIIDNPDQAKVYCENAQRIISEHTPSDSAERFLEAIKFTVQETGN
jgi:glycosyltransferase involved in cell wall biosynthesis